MKKIVATTDVWLRDKPRAKGTEFAIVEDPKSGGKPVEVDPTTAAAWLRNGWADEVKGSSPGSGRSPEALASGQPQTQPQAPK